MRFSMKHRHRANQARGDARGSRAGGVPKSRGHSSRTEFSAEFHQSDLRLNNALGYFQADLHQLMPSPAQIRNRPTLFGASQVLIYVAYRFRVGWDSVASGAVRAGRSSKPSGSRLVGR